MKPGVVIFLIVLLFSTPKAFAQEQYNLSANTIDQEILNSADDPENEQINQDEGYGLDDQEYYEAEGLNAEGMPDEK